MVSSISKKYRTYKSWPSYTFLRDAAMNLAQTDTGRRRYQVKKTEDIIYEFYTSLGKYGEWNVSNGLKVLIPGKWKRRGDLEVIDSKV